MCDNSGCVIENACRGRLLQTAISGILLNNWPWIILNVCAPIQCAFLRPCSLSTLPFVSNYIFLWIMHRYLAASSVFSFFSQFGCCSIFSASKSKVLLISFIISFVHKVICFNVFILFWSVILITLPPHTQLLIFLYIEHLSCVILRLIDCN